MQVWPLEIWDISKNGEKNSLEQEKSIFSWRFSLLSPIGSMYAIYGNIYHQYIPPMLAYIPCMDPMGHDYHVLELLELELHDGVICRSLAPPLPPAVSVGSVPHLLGTAPTAPTAPAASPSSLRPWAKCAMGCHRIHRALDIHHAASWNNLWFWIQKRDSNQLEGNQ